MTVDPYASAAAHGEAAVGWAAHALDPDEEVTFLAHLDGCPECLDAVADASATLAALGGSGPQEEPPARLREALRGAVADEPAPPRRIGPTEPRRAGTATPSDAGRGPSDDRALATVVPMRPAARRTRRLEGVLAVAAAVVLVVVIGVLAAANRTLQAERDAQAADAQRAEQVTTVLRDAGRPGAVHATLADRTGTMVGMVVDTGSGPSVLSIGLGDNRPDETYVLWSLAGPQPRPVGPFDVSGSAPSVRSMGASVPTGQVSAFAVSLEPGRSAPVAPTRIVASGPVGR